MSRLRDQLQQARRQYESAQYPGDLAQEMLGHRLAPGKRRWGWWVAAGAVAAAICLTLLMRGGTFTPPPLIQPAPQQVAIAEEPSTLLVPAIPEMPEAVAMLPEVENSTLLLPAAMPTMPSFSWFATYDDAEQDQTNSDEK